MKSIDIVTLVNNNPIKIFSKDYNSKLIEKLKEKFSDEEKQLFITNFYCYLSYEKEDFVIRLDDIWLWLGYSRIDIAKRLLQNIFKEGDDYIIDKIISNHGGQNKENIKLTINCFKKLCLVAKTKKASKIHDYYLTLEQIFFDLLVEQSKDFTEQLTLKEKEIKEIKDVKYKIIKANVELYLNKNVFYIFVLKDENGVIYEAKFGWSNDIKRREKEHKETYGQHCYFIYIVETLRNIKMENEVKRTFKDHIFEREYNGKNKIELIRFDDNFTFEMFQNGLVSIRDNIESKDNLLKDLKECEEEIKNLKNTIQELDNECDELANEKDDLIDENEKLIKENKKLIEENKKLMTDLISSTDKDLREREIKERQKTNELMGYKIQEIQENKKPNNLSKYQIYDPKTLKLVKSFKNIYEIQKELGLTDDMRYEISRASNKNTILKKFRIFKLNHNQDETIEYKIPETYEINRTPHNEQVVCFNNTGTEIIGIFSNSKEASEFIKQKDKLPNDVKQIKKSITSNLGPSNKIINTAYGYRWFRIGEFIKEEENENENENEESENENEDENESLKEPVKKEPKKEPKKEIKKRKFDNEDEKQPYLEIFNKYLETHEIPKYIANKNQKLVYKYDIDQKIIITYNSVSEALREGKFSDVTLHKNIKNKTLLKNGYWSYDNNFNIEQINSKKSNKN